MKKILIFGCGSIGQRHIRVLKKIGNFDIAAYRTKKGFFQEMPRDLKNVKEFFSEEDAFDWRPNYMVISNPTSLHLEYLLKGIDEGIANIFVEKPLVNNYSDIENRLEKLLSYNGSISVGFNLRFNVVVKELKKIIESKKYGRVLNATLEVGKYLPIWHPDEDYRKNYAARKDLGGGVLRTLCHEIDLAQYFFGSFKTVFGKINKISDLEINVDDYVCILVDMDEGIKVEIKLDYLRPVAERKGEILFEKGLLRYDMRGLNIKYAGYEKEDWQTLFSLNEYDKDTSYQEQIEAFINKDFRTLCPLQEGINVMKVIEMAEKSSEEGKLYVSAKR